MQGCSATNTSHQSLSFFQGWAQMLSHPELFWSPRTEVRFISPVFCRPFPTYHSWPTSGVANGYWLFAVSPCCTVLSPIVGICLRTFEPSICRIKNICAKNIIMEGNLTRNPQRNHDIILLSSQNDGLSWTQVWFSLTFGGIWKKRYTLKHPHLCGTLYSLITLSW